MCECGRGLWSRGCERSGHSGLRLRRKRLEARPNVRNHSVQAVPRDGRPKCTGLEVPAEAAPIRRARRRVSRSQDQPPFFTYLARSTLRQNARPLSDSSAYLRAPSPHRNETRDHEPGPQQDHRSWFGNTAHEILFVVGIDRCAYRGSPSIERSGRGRDVITVLL